MPTEENKALIRRTIEARNANDIEAFAGFFPTDWHEGVRRAFNGVTEAFPDVHITIEELIGEGDKIVSHWSFQGTHLGLYQDIPATGKKVNYTRIDIYTIVDGKVVSVVRETDNLVVLQQLGVNVSNQPRATL
jgi:predicted ester cyclase